MTQPKLTTAFVKMVAEPGRYGDGGRGSFGLSLLVKPGKRGGLIKNWQQRYSRYGKYSSRGLGVYPAVSLEQARALAANFALQNRPLTVQYVYGATDEQAEGRLVPVRHEIQAAVTFEPVIAEATVNREIRKPTLRQVFLESLDFRSGGFKTGSKTVGQAKGLFDTYINRQIADRPIDDVQPNDLIECLGAVWYSKPATAKKMIQHLGSAFHHAIGKDLIDVDPLVKAKIALGRLRQKVQNFGALAYSVVPDALAYVRESNSYPSKKLAFQFLVLTAGRTSEITGANWNEIDWENRTWVVPGERMKTAREHRVPLSSTAMDVLNEAKAAGQEKPTGPIFTNEKGQTMNHDGIRQLVKRQYPNATSHGFRSSFRDWAAELTDYPSEIVEHALAHVEGSATVRAYRRTDFFMKRRDLMQAWADYITR